MLGFARGTLCLYWIRHFPPRTWDSGPKRPMLKAVLRGGHKDDPRARLPLKQR